MHMKLWTIQSRWWRRLLEFSMGLLLAVLPVTDGLAQWQFGASARLEYIENPQRIAEADDQSEVLREGRVQVGYQGETQRFATDIDYQARRIDYRNELLRDRTLVNGRSTITWNAVPDTLSWNLSHVRSFPLVNVRQPDTTDNRQVVNTVSTGPQLNLRLGQRNIVNLRATYSLTDYGLSELPEQTRKSGIFSFTHIFTTRYSATLNASTARAEFDNFPLYEFRIDSYSLTQNYSTQSWGITLEAGRDVIKRNFVPDQDNLLLRVDGNYNISSRAVISAGYSESAEDLLSNIQNLPLRSVNLPGLEFPIDDLVGDGVGDSGRTQAYKQERKSIGYSYTVPERGGFNVSYSHLRRFYNEAGEDQLDEGVTVRGSFPINASMGMNAFARYSELEFSRFSVTQYRKQYGASTNYQLSNRFSLQLSVMNTEQSGNTVLDNYEGLNAFIAINYRH